MNFEFSSSRRILFGTGALAQIATASELAQVTRVMLVRTKYGADHTLLENILSELKISCTTVVIQGEPTIQDVEFGIELAREERCERVIGFGGGSALDSAKAIAALATNPGRLLDYLEVVGQGKVLLVPALGVVAIPTTAGTGSEVTRNAVITVPDQLVKVSLRSPGMLPWLAIVDPRLTYSLPPNITASTGMDALTQVLEPFVSNKANPITDEFCRAAFKRVTWALRTCVKDGQNSQAREDMSFVSLMGGLALANAGLGAVHGLAGPIGGRFSAPHGLVCARLLSAVVSTNVRALRARGGGVDALMRYHEAARSIMQSELADADDLAPFLMDLCEELCIPSLSSIGMRGDDIAGIVKQAAVASSMKANPIVLNHDEMQEILERSL